MENRARVPELPPERKQEIAWLSNVQDSMVSRIGQMLGTMGRGAFVVFDDKKIDLDGERLYKYLSEKSLKKVISNRLAENMIKSYNPEEAYVVVFLKPNRVVNTYIIKLPDDNSY